MGRAEELDLYLRRKFWGCLLGGIVGIAIVPRKFLGGFRQVDIKEYIIATVGGVLVGGIIGIGPMRRYIMASDQIHDKIKYYIAELLPEEIIISIPPTSQPSPTLVPIQPIPKAVEPKMLYTVYIGSDYAFGPFGYMASFLDKRSKHAYIALVPLDATEKYIRIETASAGPVPFIKSVVTFQPWHTADVMVTRRSKNTRKFQRKLKNKKKMQRVGEVKIAISVC